MRVGVVGAARGLDVEELPRTLGGDVSIVRYATTPTEPGVRALRTLPTDLADLDALLVAGSLSADGAGFDAARWVTPSLLATLAGVRLVWWVDGGELPPWSAPLLELIGGYAGLLVADDGVAAQVADVLGEHAPPSIAPGDEDRDGALRTALATGRELDFDAADVAMAVAATVASVQRAGTRRDAELRQLRDAYDRLLREGGGVPGGGGDPEELRRAQAKVAQARRELDDTQEALDQALGAVAQLDAWVDQLTTEFDKLIASNRYKVGDKIGTVLEKARGGDSPTKATERVDDIAEEYRRWKADGHVAAAGDRPASLHQPSQTGTGGVGETTGRRKPRGWDAASDAERRQQRYERWMAEIEEPPAARTPAAPRVRGIVLAHVGVDLPRHRLGLGRTLQAAAERLDAVTLITDQPAAAQHGVDTARPAELLEHLDAVPEPFVVFLLPGDQPSPTLTATVEHEVQAPVTLVDHDVVAEDGVRRDPRFSPALSPDLVVEADTLGRGAIFHRDALVGDGAPTEPLIDPDRNLVRDLVLRLHDNGVVVDKLDRVLVHHGPDTRTVPQQLDDDEAFAWGVLQRRGADATVERTPWSVRVRYGAPDGLTSIIVPFRDRADLTRRCVESILRVSTDHDYEILLIDNRSQERETDELLVELVTRDDRVRVLPYDHEFNYSKLNNWAVDRARGDVLVFLNNDTQILAPDWLQRLRGWATQPGIGLVGGRLHFQNGSVQHSGVVIGVGGFAAHAFATHHVPHIPHPDVRQARNWSAVTGALCATTTRNFREVGGFDERFLVTGSDVELGLRYRRSGYRNVVDPDVVAFHFEKESRAAIPTQRVDKLLSLETYLPELKEGDPYWNANLSAWSTAWEPRVEEEEGYEELVAKVMGENAEAAEQHKKLGEAGFLARYDASAADIAANGKHVAAFLADRQVSLDRVTWFVPAFDHVYRGGIYTIFRFANHFTKERGTHNQVVLTGKTRVDLEGTTRQVRQAFPDLDVELIHLPLDEPEDDLPPADVGICTLWTGAYHLLRYNQCRGKFYLVQDYEPSFYAGNAMQGLVTQTYRFGFQGIANTPGVGDGYAAFGNTVYSFVPAVDRHVYYPPKQPKPADEPVQIVFYGRPKNERNGFELGAQALTEVKRRYGDRVHIVSAGAEFHEGAHDLAGVLDNLGVLPNIEAVGDVYRRSDIGLVFMFSRHPSYQPLEYMASGTATVTNINEANMWLYRQRENVLLTPPSVTAVADAISELVEDRSLREQIIAGGEETIAPLSWDRELDNVLRYVETGEMPEGVVHG